MSRGAFVWGAALFAAAMTLVPPLVQRISNQESSGSFHYLNSDMQYVPDLVRDMNAGADLSGWTIPPANYFFPDLPVFAVFLKVTGMPGAAIYAGLFLYALNLVSLIIFLRCARGSFLDAPYVLAGGALLVLALVLEYLPAQSFALILPTFHTTAIAGCLILCSLQVCRMHPGLRVIGSFLVSFLFSFSDSLFLGVSGAAMAAFVLLELRHARLGKSLLPVLAWLAGAALARKTLDWLPLNVIRVRPELDVLQSLRTHEFMSTVVTDLQPWFYFIPTAAALWLTIRGFISSSPFRQKLVLPAAAGAVCLAGASLFSRQVGLPAVEHRYAIYALFFMILAAVLFCRHLTGRLTLFVLSLVMLSSAVSVLRKPEVSSPHLARAACLDTLAAAHKFKRGLADYWHAKSLTAASQRVRINQVDAALGPRPWINNLRWYLDESGNALSYSFIIPMRLHEHEILKRFGAPKTVEVCEGMPVWIYSSDGSEPLVPFSTAEFLAWRAAVGR